MTKKTRKENEQTEFTLTMAATYNVHELAENIASACTPEQALELFKAIDLSYADYGITKGFMAYFVKEIQDHHRADGEPLLTAEEMEVQGFNG